MGLAWKMGRSREFKTADAAMAMSKKLRTKVRKRKGTGKFTVAMSPDVGGGWHVACYGGDGTFKGYVK